MSGWTCACGAEPEDTREHQSGCVVWKRTQIAILLRINAKYRAEIALNEATIARLRTGL